MLGPLILLAVLRLVGEMGLKLGPYDLPEIPRWWIAVAGVVVFFIVPQSTVPLKPRRWLLGALALGFASGPLSAWRHRLDDDAPRLTAQVFFLDPDGAKYVRSVDVESPEFEERRDLNRLAGRRRNVRLTMDAFIWIPTTGNHRFTLSCDDRCSISLNEKQIIEAMDAAEKEVFVEAGLHPISIFYWQRAGAAFLSLDWDRPAFAEILPFESFVAENAERITPQVLRSRKRAILGLALAWFSWWLFALGLLVRSGESRRAWQKAISTHRVRAGERWPYLGRAGPGPVQALRGLGSNRFLTVVRQGSAWAGVATGLVLPLYLLPSAVRISATQGDWKSVTEGFQLSGQPVALGGGRRSVVHFHDLDGRSGEVRLRIGARYREVPVTLTVWEGKNEHFRALIEDTVPTLITVPVPRNSEEIEIRMEAETDRTVTGAVILLREIELSRSSDAASSLLKALCIAAALVLLLINKDSFGWRTALAAALVASLASSAVVVLFDPTAAFAFAPLNRDGFRILALALLWLLAWTARRTQLAALTAIVGTVGLLYLPSLDFGFLTDDFLFGRPLTSGELLSTLYGHWDPHGLANDHYRPVVAWSLAWDYWIWGDNPQGYHLTNILIHVLNGIVAFVLFRHIRLSEKAALVGALLWCAHPMGAASVSWANERTDGIMAAFYLASLVQLTAPDFTRRHAVGTIALGALALGSKELAVTLPFVGFLVIYGAGLDRAKLRYTTVGGLFVAVILYLVVWLSLFPDKSSLALGLAFQAPDTESITTHTLVGLYPAVFLPSIYGWWNKVQQVGAPLWYILGGLAMWPLTWGIFRLLGGGVAEDRAVRLGGLWPIVTVAPLLGLKGGVDLFRLGLLLAVGFGLTLGTLISVVDRRTPRLACCLLFVSAVGLGYATLRSSEAWGPGGWMMNLGTRWKLSSQTWQDQISTEMRQLFFEQVEMAEHARLWVASGESP